MIEELQPGDLLLVVPGAAQRYLFPFYTITSENQRNWNFEGGINNGDILLFIKKVAMENLLNRYNVFCLHNGREIVVRDKHIMDWTEKVG